MWACSEVRDIFANISSIRGLCPGYSYILPDTDEKAMNNVLNTALLLLLCLGITSCSSLKSVHYVGEKEPSKGIGFNEETIWQFDKEVYYVRSTGPESIVASTLDWDEKNKQYVVSTYHIVVSKLNETYFLNAKKEGDEYYTILLLSPSVEQMFSVFSVDGKILDKHIETGKIKASKRNREYILDVTKDELDRYIQENVKELFDFKNSGIIKPIKGFREEK